MRAHLESLTLRQPAAAGAVASDFEAEVVVPEAIPATPLPGAEQLRLLREEIDPYGTSRFDFLDASERAAYVLHAGLVIEGPTRSNALAEAVHSDPSTISRQIGHLVKLGYVDQSRIEHVLGTLIDASVQRVTVGIQPQSQNAESDQRISPLLPHLRHLSP